MMRPALSLAHSPDSDDAFLFYGLVSGKVKTPLIFREVLKDIETLNRWALRGKLDVTALSFHAYGLAWKDYLLLPHGASIGYGYGPVIVARKRTALDGRRIALPGKFTTAALVLRLAVPSFRPVYMRFDEIERAVAAGKADAGALIHEGQITHRLTKVLDLGRWWKDETGLPLPLGANAVRRGLGPAVCAEVARALKRSIAYGFSHMEEAMAHAARFGREMDAATAERFVRMYVTTKSAARGKERRGIEELFRRAKEVEMLGDVRVEFAAY